MNASPPATLLQSAAEIVCGMAVAIPVIVYHSNHLEWYHFVGCRKPQGWSLALAFMMEPSKCSLVNLRGWERWPIWSGFAAIQFFLSLVSFTGGKNSIWEPILFVKEEYHWVLEFTIWVLLFSIGFLSNPCEDLDMGFVDLGSLLWCCWIGNWFERECNDSV